jgi:hypothetical protein
MQTPIWPPCLSYPFESQVAFARQLQNVLNFALALLPWATIPLLVFPSRLPVPYHEISILAHRILRGFRVCQVGYKSNFRADGIFILVAVSRFPPTAPGQIRAELKWVLVSPCSGGSSLPCRDSMR